MPIRLFQPPTSLQNHIQYIWSDDLSVYPIPSEIRISKFAETNPRMYFYNPKEDSELRTETGKALPICHLKGIDTQKSTAVIAPKSDIIGVCFYPHALQDIFDIAPKELIDMQIDINHLKAKELTDCILRCKTTDERVECIFHFAYTKIQSKKKLFHPALKHLVGQKVLRHNTNLDEVSKEINLSRRQLERIFKSQIGVSPNKFQSIQRFEKALSLIKNEESLTSLSNFLEYADQSHFIKDFRKYADMTPSQYLKLKIQDSHDNTLRED
ncbi:response regulator transcription factor [Soonwooa sp.]|uniref:response regulator transcription factor n=1 Tax=Soonwooa sp. TaxID=1938592 RepID=UPI002609DC81|nr:response regulator transcription factor [Soonwooa sp.]